MAQVDPLQYAIQLERDGQAFYTEVAARTANPLGRRTFEALAADERRHEQVLLGLARKARVALEGEMPKQRLVTLFSTLGAELRAQLDADTGDTAALEKALAMENASIAHYREQAGKAGDAGTRSLYERLVREENEHADILRNCLTYLNKTGQWFLWDEGALLDGG